jgi:hypothetical protein
MTKNYFALLDSDPDPDSESGSASDSTDLTVLNQNPDLGQLFFGATYIHRND